MFHTKINNLLRIGIFGFFCVLSNLNSQTQALLSEGAQSSEEARVSGVETNDVITTQNFFEKHNFIDPHLNSFGNQCIVQSTLKRISNKLSEEDVVSILGYVNSNIFNSCPLTFWKCIDWSLEPIQKFIGLLPMAASMFGMALVPDENLKIYNFFMISLGVANFILKEIVAFAESKVKIFNRRCFMSHFIQPSNLTEVVGAPNLPQEVQEVSTTGTAAPVTDLPNPVMAPGISPISQENDEIYVSGRDVIETCGLDISRLSANMQHIVIYGFDKLMNKSTSKDIVRKFTCKTVPEVKKSMLIRMFNKSASIIDILSGLNDGVNVILPSVTSFFDDNVKIMQIVLKIIVVSNCICKFLGSISVCLEKCTHQRIHRILEDKMISNMAEMEANSNRPDQLIIPVNDVL